MEKTLDRQPLNLVQRIVLAGLLLCMALAQSLSFAHRALHHDVRMLAHAYEEQHAEQHAQAHGHGADCDHGIFGRLFASHEEGDETCRVIDGANAFLDLNSHIAGVFAVRYAPVLVAFDAAARAAWQEPLFEARGPPVHSL